LPETLVADPLCTEREVVASLAPEIALVVDLLVRVALPLWTEREVVPPWTADPL